MDTNHPVRAHFIRNDSFVVSGAGESHCKGL